MKTMVGEVSKVEIEGRKGEDARQFEVVVKKEEQEKRTTAG